MNSYLISGENSARLLLMTATPITKDPMELIKIVNLCKLPNEQMPESFDEFSHRYLNEDGIFTESGKAQYLDEIAGHISYLNREKDARQFSQPIIKQVLVPMVSEKQMKDVDNFDKAEIDGVDAAVISDLEKQVDEQTAEMSNWTGINKKQFKYLTDKCNVITDVKNKKECLKTVNSEIADIVRIAKEKANVFKQKIKVLKEEISNLKLDVKTKKKMNLANIKQNIEQSEGEYGDFKKGLFYNIKNMCGKKSKDITNLKKAAETLPEIEEINALIEDTDKRMVQLKEDFKIKVSAMKKQMAEIKKNVTSQIKNDKNLTASEKEAMRKSIKDKEIENTKNIKTETKNIKEIVTTLKKSMKNYETRKKKMILNTQKTFKNKLKDEVKNEKILLKLKNKVDNLDIDVANDKIKEIIIAKKAHLDDVIEKQYELNEFAKQQEAMKEIEKHDKLKLKEIKENEKAKKKEIADKAKHDKEIEKREKQLKKEEEKKEKQTLKLQNDKKKEEEKKAKQTLKLQNDKKKEEEKKAKKEKQNKTKKNTSK
jgi:hypothetical protein